MIRLHRVCKVFEGGPMKVPALNDISFEVDKGDFVVLSGASGAGKTTLLRLLYADERVSDGDIEMAGEILDLIKDIWSRGTTVLLATHQARLAAQLKRRTVRLENGVLTKDEG